MSRTRKKPPKPSTNGFVPGPVRPPPEPAKPKERIEVCWASEIAAEEPQWLCYPWIPRQALSLVVGHATTGKSTFIATLLAHVTGGPAIGKGMNGKPGRAVFLNGFEETAKVLTIPRLLKCGVDMDRVRMIKRGHVTLLHDRDWLARQVREIGASLLVGDPIDSYVDDGFSEDRGQDVRPLLEAAHWIAEQENCAVVFARHPGKQDNNILPGSRHWRNVPKSILLLTQDGNLPPRYTLSLWKDGMSTGARPVRYRFAGEEGEPKRMIFEGELDQSAQELARNESGPTGRFKLMLACQVIRWLFEEEEIPTRQMLSEEGRKQGLGDDTVYEALRLLGIRSVPPHERGLPWRLVRTHKEWPAWLSPATPPEMPEDVRT